MTTRRASRVRPRGPSWRERWTVFITGLRVVLRWAWRIGLWLTFLAAVVLVSHDRYLLNNTADTFWWVNGGGVTEYSGDLEDYFQTLLKQPDKLQGHSSASTGESSVADKKMLRQQKAAERDRLKPLLRKLKKVESELDIAQTKLVELEASLADTTLYQDDQKNLLQNALQAEADERQNVDRLEHEWLSLSEQVEAAEAST
jgi:ATP-binding cassette subfamily F protein 3